MLRGSHQPPSRAQEARGKRAKIAGRNQDQTARRKLAMAARKRFVRLRQMLDDVKERDDINSTYLGHVRFVSHARQHRQACSATSLRSLLGDLDARNFEKTS